MSCAKNQQMIVLKLVFILLMMASGIRANPKLSPEFQSIIQSSRTLKKDFGNSNFPGILKMNPQGEAVYGTIVYTKNPEDLISKGIEFQSRWPEFVTVHATKNILLKLSGIESVHYIEPCRWDRENNDIALAVTGADMLHAGYIKDTNLTGKGVLICIIDSGIDWTHRDFRDPDDPSKSRILAIWDHTLEATGNESTPDETGCNYGVEYKKADIENELTGVTSGFVRTQDISGHGTHVAGTAAGNGSAHPSHKYKGMAPEADIIVVKAGEGSYPQTNIVNGLNYANQKAAALGIPLAVNISLGSNSGPHDGTDIKSQAIDVFCSSGRGRVVAASAGNEGNNMIHTSGTLEPGISTFIYVDVETYVAESGTWNDDFSFEVWFDSNGETSIQVKSPNGFTHTQSNITDPSESTTDGNIYLLNRVDFTNNNRYIYGRIADETEANPPVQGFWRLAITNSSNQSINYHMWLTDWDIGEDGEVSVNGGDSGYTLSNTSEKAIVTGNYAHRWRWADNNDGFWSWRSGDDLSDNIYLSSSHGPTRDGRQKPDITAPGTAVASSLSSQDVSYADHRIMDGQKHILANGTSMASPVVAGAAALMLQADPNLNSNQISSYMEQEATLDTYTASVWNKEWGYGKLNVFNALSAATHPQVTDKHEVLVYNNWDGDEGWRFDSGESVAFRFMPSSNGKVSGVLFHASASMELINNMEVQIWSDTNGRPWQNLSSSYYISPDDISIYSWTFKHFEDEGVSVSKDRNYHIVLTAQNGESATYRVDPTPSVNRTHYKNTDSQIWYSRDYNVRFRPVITPAKSNYPTSVSDDVDIQKSFYLSHAWPNPFNPETNIEYHLQQTEDVYISVYDIHGRRVQTLVNKAQATGQYMVQWQGVDWQGNNVASGVYFLKAEIGEYQQFRKLMLIR